jgi:hypothetical protein
MQPTAGPEPAEGAKAMGKNVSNNKPDRAKESYG